MASPPSSPPTAPPIPSSPAALSTICAISIAKSLPSFKNALSSLPEELLLLILDKLNDLGCMNEANLALLLHPQLKYLRLAKAEEKITDKIFSYLPCK